MNQFTLKQSKYCQGNEKHTNYCLNLTTHIQAFENAGRQLINNSRVNLALSSK
jgi:hypothetical protein